jgi:hypothetical protein
MSGLRDANGAVEAMKFLTSATQKFPKEPYFPFLLGQTVQYWPHDLKDSQFGVYCRSDEYTMRQYENSWYDLIFMTLPLHVYTELMSTSYTLHTHKSTHLSHIYTFKRSLYQSSGRSDLDTVIAGMLNDLALIYFESGELQLAETAYRLAIEKNSRMLNASKFAHSYIDFNKLNK